MDQKQNDQKGINLPSLESVRWDTGNVVLATQAARGEVRVKSTVSRSPSSPLLTCGPLKLDLHQAGKLPCSVPKASAPNMTSFFLPNSCSQQQPWVLRPPGTCLCWWASSLSGPRTCSLGMGSYKWRWGSQITHQKVKWAMWGTDQGTAPSAHHPAGMPLSLPAQDAGIQIEPCYICLGSLSKSGSKVLQQPHVVTVKTQSVCI